MRLFARRAAAGADRSAPHAGASAVLCDLHVIYASYMTVNVQIRNVPEAWVSELKARAAAQRASLSEYLLRELEELVAAPPLDDFLDERVARPRRVLGVAAADAVRDARRDETGDE